MSALSDLAPIRKLAQDVEIDAKAIPGLIRRGSYQHAIELIDDARSDLDDLENLVKKRRQNDDEYDIDI